TVFHTDGDYRVFLELLAAAKATHPITIRAFCLRPNHFHLVLQPIRNASLSPFMHWWMTSHVRRYHRSTAVMGLCGKADSNVSRFNKTPIFSPPSAMSCTIQSEPGWWSTPTSGPGPVCSIPNWQLRSAWVT
ncbi:MAG: transposase, partial [Nitrospira sp.]|nr:transposase [Nitrospira sp.]